MSAAQLGWCEAHCQAPLDTEKQFLWGGTGQEAVQWVCYEKHTASSWLLYQYQGLQDTRNAETPPGTAPASKVKGD